MSAIEDCMEFEEKKPKVCRLCGQCANICVDVFGGEGNDRVLAQKIESKINILIQPNDGLPQAICMGCADFLGFFCDFCSMCHETQKNFKSPNEEVTNTKAIEYDVESNTDAHFDEPNNIKRKGQLLQSESFKCQKTAECTPETDPFHYSTVKIENNSFDLDDISSVGEYGACIQEDSQTAVNVDSTDQDIKKEITINKASSKSISTTNAKCKSTRKKRAKVSNFRKCKLCNKQCNSAETLKRHMKIHTKQLPYQCDLCEYGSKYKESLVNHILYHNAKMEPEEREKQKRDIDALYSTDMNVIDQSKVNENIISAGKSKFQCKICYGKKMYLGTCEPHVWRHLNMKPYMCKVCDYSAVDISTIRGHINERHLKIKSFECQSCNSYFGSVPILKKHMKIHTDLRPYQCDLCKYTSKIKRSLANHILAKHSKILLEKEERSVDKLFSIDEKLINESKHDKNVIYLDSKFQCKICNKEFPKFGKCQVHVWRHLNIKPYSCKECNHSTVTRSEIRFHIQCRHI